MKKLHSLVLIGLLCTVLTAIFSSCVQTVIEDKNAKKFKGGFRDKTLPKKHYKKLKDYYLVLYPVGNNSIITLDKDATVKLRLRNFADKKVLINEWYMKTPNNICLYYRPFDLRVEKFVAKTWTKVTPKLEAVALRFELELMPKNSVLIVKKLNFMNKLNLKQGETKRFLMVAELNLNSVKVRSRMFSVEIRQK